MRWCPSPRSADHRAAEVRGVGVEELVLGEGLERRDRRLVVVGSLEEVLLAQDPRELAPQDGDAARPLAVGLGGEEAEHARLPDDVALRVDAADADVVHARAPVDRRHAVGLGDDQKVAVDDALAQALGHVGERDGARVGGGALVAQQAQARAGRDADPALGDLVLR